MRTKTAKKQPAASLLKQAREDADLSQTQLAAAICRDKTRPRITIDQASISRYETGRGIPRLETAKKLAVILKVQLIDILNPPPGKQRKAA